MVGVLFRANGQTETLIGGAGQVTVPNWTANDLVTITLKDSVGTGSAFDGNGSFATVQIGANTIGTFDLGTQTNAYFTFGAFNFETSQFGGGTFDNFSVTAIPEPSAALLGSLLLFPDSRFPEVPRLAGRPPRCRPLSPANRREVEIFRQPVT
jgi:hypothetical protein